MLQRIANEIPSWSELYAEESSSFTADERRVLLRLVANGTLSAYEAREVVELNRRHRTRLLDILTAMGRIRPREYASVLARVVGRSYVSGLVGSAAFEPDRELIGRFDPAVLVRSGFCPLLHSDGLLVVLAVEPNDPHIVEQVKQVEPDAQVVTMVGTQLDVTLLVDQTFQTQLLAKSTDELRMRHPRESASEVFTAGQTRFFSVLVLMLVFGLLQNLWATLSLVVLLFSVFYTTSIGFKLLISIVGSRDEYRLDIEEDTIGALRDDELPVYSILVPVYKEPEVVAHLLAALGRMDYPQEKLDVLILMEADDHETIEAAKAAHPPSHFRFIYIPPGQPRTKPKACNYGLNFCRGEYVTIYDAEDIPEPDQLKKAVLAFREGSDSLVCVQSALNYFNSNENYLTRMFTLEYSYWFDYMLPGLDRLRLPIPLGGTSNHFRLDRLRELGAWDPYNVTEDADLGIRASARGYTVGIINSTTYEEANKELKNWLRQRSRWIKGYMQTWLVHNRYPLPLMKKLGPRRWVSYQFFIGGTCLTFLANPVMWLLYLFWFLIRPDWIAGLFEGLVLYLATFNFLIGNMLGIYLNMLAVFRRKLFHLTPYALTNPIYWWLHSFAAYIALWQLFTKPFYWEKTQHGLTSVKAQALAEQLQPVQAARPATIGA